MVYHYSPRVPKRLLALAIFGIVLLALTRLLAVPPTHGDATATTKTMTRIKATAENALDAFKGKTVEAAANQVAERKTLPSRALSRQYDREDVYWLAKIVEAEAEGEPYDGKVAVADVVLNRVDTGWAKRIRDVIFQKGQFEPVSNGRVYKVTPTQETLNAVLDALAGKETVPASVVYFQNPKLATDNYITKNQTLVTVIGSHAFYK